ncbi:MAG: NUDIX domain-containing protein [Candidatus Heimdallarchaeota archaeon]|nr:MAG: NUDIX domain-containing protein [Candidatus Heimdallarchaeota archaeon]
MSNQEGKFMIGIGAIIENSRSGKILLLHRNPSMDFAGDQWDDVGGRMCQFETPEETLNREVKEETGITDLTIIKPIDVSHYFRGAKIAYNEMIVITYWCKTTSDEITLSSEHDDYRWVFPEEALKLIDDASLKRNIQRYSEERKG